MRRFGWGDHRFPIMWTPRECADFSSWSTACISERVSHAEIAGRQSSASWLAAGARIIVSDASIDPRGKRANLLFLGVKGLRITRIKTNRESQRVQVIEKNQ